MNCNEFCNIVVFVVFKGFVFCIILLCIVLLRPMLHFIANAAEAEQTGNRRENVLNYSTTGNFTVTQNIKLIIYG